MRFQPEPAIRRRGGPARPSRPRNAQRLRARSARTRPGPRRRTPPPPPAPAEPEAGHRMRRSGRGEPWGQRKAGPAAVQAVACFPGGGAGWVAARAAGAFLVHPAGAACEDAPVPGRGGRGWGRCAAWCPLVDGLGGGQIMGQLGPVVEGGLAHRRSVAHGQGVRCPRLVARERAAPAWCRVFCDRETREGRGGRFRRPARAGLYGAGSDPPASGSHGQRVAVRRCSAPPDPPTQRGLGGSEPETVLRAPPEKRAENET